MRLLDGKVALVTGAALGLGNAFARALAAEGAQLSVCDVRDEVMELSGAIGKQVLTMKADVSKAEDVRRVVDTTKQELGRIDVLVNNHGAGVKIAKTEDQDDAAIAEALETNLASVIKGCREVVPYMKKQKSGLIVNVSSACAYHSWPNWGVYTAAKAGVVGFTRCLHLEMLEWGGRATNFIPGAARTNFCKAAKVDDSWLEGFPSAHDFARCIVQCIDTPDNCFIEEVSIWGVKQVISPF